MDTVAVGMFSERYNPSRVAKAPPSECPTTAILVAPNRLIPVRTAARILGPELYRLMLESSREGLCAMKKHKAHT